MTSFADLNLHPDIMKSIEKLGFDKPTEIQAQFVPLALEGRDVMASAQTGSGKTAAFLLPAFQKILDNPDESKAQRKKRGPRVLVLTPTRELAEQVMKVAKDLRAFTDITVMSVTGGVPVMKHKRMLRDNIDVLVATPGRLIDLMNQGVVHLKDIETLILDEADRMLDMGFSDDVLKISRATASNRQALLLSATLEGNIGGVIKQVMNNPAQIELAHAAQKHENITQCLYRANDARHKQQIIDKLVEDQKIWQAVVFCGTKSMTEKLADKLRAQGEKVDVLHGDMRQSARNKSIRRMMEGHIRFLVATDVAARGLDIKELTHVINFDLPRNAEDYTHRIGRVGRAGRKGDAISLVSNDQWGLMAGIERMIGESVEQKMIEGLEYTPSRTPNRTDKGKGHRRTSVNVKSKGSFSRRDEGSSGNFSRDRNRSGGDSSRGSDSRGDSRRSYGKPSGGSSDGGRDSSRSFGRRDEGSSNNGSRGDSSRGNYSKPSGERSQYRGDSSRGDASRGNSGSDRDGNREGANRGRFDRSSSDSRSFGNRSGGDSSRNDSSRGKYGKPSGERNFGNRDGNRNDNNASRGDSSRNDSSRGKYGKPSGSRDSGGRSDSRSEGNSSGKTYGNPSSDNSRGRFAKPAGERSGNRADSNSSGTKRKYNSSTGVRSDGNAPMQRKSKPTSQSAPY